MFEGGELLVECDATLTKTKYVWLQKPTKMKRSRRLLLRQLIHSSLRTARAWNKWIGWAMSSKLEPMIRAAKIVEKHLDGIIKAIMFRLEGLDLYPQTATTHTDS